MGPFGYGEGSERDPRPLADLGEVGVGAFDFSRTNAFKQGFSSATIEDAIHLLTSWTPSGCVPYAVLRQFQVDANRDGTSVLASGQDLVLNGQYEESTYRVLRYVYDHSEAVREAANRTLRETPAHFDEPVPLPTCTGQKTLGYDQATMKSQLKKVGVGDISSATINDATNMVNGSWTPNGCTVDPVVQQFQSDANADGTSVAAGALSDAGASGQGLTVDGQYGQQTYQVLQYVFAQTPDVQSAANGASVPSPTCTGGGGGGTQPQNNNSNTNQNTNPSNNNSNTTNTTTTASMTPLIIGGALALAAVVAAVMMSKGGGAPPPPSKTARRTTPISRRTTVTHPTRGMARTTRPSAR